jgi:RNA-directed DNA polymerase
LANIYLHHAFDTWMAREFQAVPFERYVDDVILHCKSVHQARFVHKRIAERMAGCGVELNPRKTRIVYCKDSNRKGSHEHERFDFLGYTFRPRRAKGRNGELFVSFLPAVSDDAMKAMSTTIKRWRLHLWNGQTLTELAQDTNKQVRGWINYYGGFYPSVLIGFLRRIDEYLVRWAMRKYKRLKGRRMRTWEFLASVKTREPNLFAHWRATQTNGRMMGAV